MLVCTSRSGSLEEFICGNLRGFGLYGGLSGFLALAYTR